MVGSTTSKISINFDTLKAGAATFAGRSIIELSGDFVNRDVYQIRGNHAIVTGLRNAAPNTTEYFINATGNVKTTIIIDEVQSQLPIAYVATSDNFWYRTDFSIVNSITDNPVIYINNTNLTTTNTYTFAGLLQTNGSNAIEFDPASTDNVIRIINATLISAANSINDPGASQTVIVVPSIANQPDVGVTIIPTGTFSVDTFGPIV